MITDAETNFVYFSGLLGEKEEYSAFHGQLVAILNKFDVNYDYLAHTRDIWCRDYMPVQTAINRFVEYRYDPDYLQTREGRDSKSWTGLICDSLKINTMKTDIFLDGGNIIRWKNKVIMTDKIIHENPRKYLKTKLIGMLEEIFEVDSIILIPWYRDEEYGHADGMVRFVNGSTVLIDGYFENEQSGFGEKLIKSLKQHNLEVIPLRFTEKSHHRNNWGYLNFLQMENLLLVPQFGIREDGQAMTQISHLFSDYDSHGQLGTIDAGVLIKDGGVLNCVSWNIARQLTGV